jgi:chromosomal replication initiation ATPase DnaA
MDGRQEMTQILAQRTNGLQSAYQYYLNRVSELEGISIEQIKGRSRKVPIVAARQMVVYLLCRKHTYSLQAIGSVAGLHHSTVIHSRETVEDGLEQPWNNMFNSIKKIDTYRPDTDEFDNWCGDGME